MKKRKKGGKKGWQPHRSNDFWALGLKKGSCATLSIAHRLWNLGLKICQEENTPPEKMRRLGPLPGRGGIWTQLYSWLSEWSQDLYISKCTWGRTIYAHSLTTSPRRRWLCFSLLIQAQRASLPCCHWYLSPSVFFLLLNVHYSKERERWSRFLPGEAVRRRPRLNAAFGFLSFSNVGVRKSHLGPVSSDDSQRMRTRP